MAAIIEKTSSGKWRVVRRNMYPQEAAGLKKEGQYVVREATAMALEGTKNNVALYFEDGGWMDIRREDSLQRLRNSSL